MGRPVDQLSAKAVGERLKLARLAILEGDDNQAEICRRLGIGLSTWNNAETGDNYPGKTILRPLQQKYGIGTDYILYDDRRALPPAIDRWIGAYQAGQAAKRA